MFSIRQLCHLLRLPIQAAHPVMSDDDKCLFLRQHREGSREGEKEGGWGGRRGRTPFKGSHLQSLKDVLKGSVSYRSAAPPNTCWYLGRGRTLSQVIAPSLDLVNVLISQINIAEEMQRVEVIPGQEASYYRKVLTILQVWSANCKNGSESFLPSIHQDIASIFFVLDSGFTLWITFAKRTWQSWQLWVNTLDTSPVLLLEVFTFSPSILRKSWANLQDDWW